MISLKNSSYRVFLLTFSILCLELALIRWTSGQIRIFAYFNNFVLIGTFLGLGIGTAIGRNGKSYLAWAMPMLFLVCIPLGLSEELGLVNMVFPDQSVALWGGEVMSEGSLPMIANIILFLAVWLLIVCFFVCLGSELGRLFSGTGESLVLYSWDLFGSFMGVVVFTLITYLNTQPVIWLVFGAIPLLLLLKGQRSAFLFLGGVMTLAYYSAGDAIYSPYNRIDIEPWYFPDTYELSVNRDFHQYLHDLSNEVVEANEDLGNIREIYDLPYQLTTSRNSAIIVGAGSGNDAQAALRNGVSRILAVDIDGRIFELGRALHPEKPYQQPQVDQIVEDARAFFVQYKGPPVDIVSYGLLDSHAMTSAMSTLRIDNFVYSEQGIREAWSHVAEDGVLVINFSLYSGAWIGERIYWTLAKATGQRPIALYHGMHTGATFIAARNAENLDLQVINSFPVFEPENVMAATRTTSDDWPYLYIRPGTFPSLYVLMIVFVFLFSAIAIPLAFGKKQFLQNFDPVLFFMGAAFLLLETRGITSLSLLFGSTWLVNSAIFGGIILIALLATLLVSFRHFKSAGKWLVIASISCLLLYWFDVQQLNAFNLITRGIAGGLIFAFPVFFAALVFPTILRQSNNPAAALGSNLLGAVLGGCLEYLSMITGLSSTAALAAILYLLAFLLWQRKKYAVETGN